MYDALGVGWVYGSETAAPVTTSWVTPKLSDSLRNTQAFLPPITGLFMECIKWLTM